MLHNLLALLATFGLYASQSDAPPTYLTNHQTITYVVVRAGVPDSDHPQTFDLPWVIEPAKLPSLHSWVTTSSGNVSILTKDGVMPSNMTYWGDFDYDELNRVVHFDGTVSIPYKSTRLRVLGVKFSFTHTDLNELTPVRMNVQRPLLAEPVSDEDLEREVMKEKGVTE